MKTLWKKLRHKLLKIFAPLAGFTYLSVVGLTSKTSVRGQAQVAELRARAPHVIYVGWHEQALNGIWTLRRRDITILISPSRDGDYIAGLVRMFGFDVARGSSSRGGVRGLLRLARIVKRTGDVIIVADGPKGPAKQCKPGALMLAKQTEMPIIPTAVMVSRAKRVRSWDRLIVPLPGAHFLMLHGEPLFVPQDADDALLEEYRQELGRRLDALGDQARQELTCA